MNLSTIKGTFQYQHTIPDQLGGSPQNMVVNQYGPSDGETVSALGFNLEKAPEIFTDSSGAPLPFVQRAMADSHGSGVFQAGVSLGAFCTGSSDRPPVAYEGDIPERGTIGWAGAAYVQRKTNVLAQAVALNYDYFVSVDPIDVTCTANAKKTLDYFRSNSTRRNFFSSRAWDNTTRREVENNDINCSVTLQPSDSESPEEQRSRVSKIEQGMKQELIAEFISNSGAKWDRIIADPRPVPGLYEINWGPSTNGLCSGHRWCDIGNLALSSARGLFGASTSSSVAVNNEFVGDFKRSYRENTYRRIKGYAAINLEVPSK